MDKIDFWLFLLRIESKKRTRSCAAAFISGDYDNIFITLDK